MHVIFVRLCRAELFDKTFILLVILTTIWSTEEDKKEEEKPENENEIVEDKDTSDTTKNPVRIAVFSVIGVVIINAKAIWSSNNLWPNEYRFWVTLVLIYVMLNYMYLYRKKGAVKERLQS